MIREQEIRLRNVRRLMSERGINLTEFAQALGKSQPQISSLAGRTPTKAIGEKIARQIEERFGLERGSLDLDSAPPPVARVGCNEVALRESLAALFAALGRHGGELPEPSRLAAAAMMLYRVADSQGETTGAAEDVARLIGG